MATLIVSNVNEESGLKKEQWIAQEFQSMLR